MQDIVLAYGALSGIVHPVFVQLRIWMVSEIIYLKNIEKVALFTNLSSTPSSGSQSAGLAMDKLLTSRVHCMDQRKLKQTLERL